MWVALISKKQLNQREKLGWYNTLVCNLASEERMDYYNFLSFDKDFFEEIIARLTTTIRRNSTNYRFDAAWFNVGNGSKVSF